MDVRSTNLFSDVASCHSVCTHLGRKCLKLRSVVLSKEGLCPQEVCGYVWRLFGYHSWGVAVTGFSWTQARDAVQHPTKHRLPLPTAHPVVSSPPVLTLLTLRNHGLKGLMFTIPRGPLFCFNFIRKNISFYQISNYTAQYLLIHKELWPPFLGEREGWVSCNGSHKVFLLFGLKRWELRMG